MLFEALRHQLGRTVPFARLLGIEVALIDGQRGTLFTLCESASGAALAGAMAEAITDTRLVVRDAQLECLQPARGVLIAKACLVDEAVRALKALRRDGHVDMAMDVGAASWLSDGTETRVARASFNG